MSELPQSVRTALSKQQDRVYLLHLEKDLTSFIKRALISKRRQQPQSSDKQQSSNKQQSSDKQSSDKQSSDKQSSDKQSSDKQSSDKQSSDKDKSQYIIQAVFLKNSYYRLLSHQLCQYYQLEHISNSSNEIVVILRDGFNYEHLLKRLDGKYNEDETPFLKLSDFVQQNANSQNDPSTSSAESTSGNIPVKPKMLMKKRPAASSSPSQSASSTPAVSNSPAPTSTSISPKPASNGAGSSSREQPAITPDSSSTPKACDHLQQNDSSATSRSTSTIASPPTDSDASQIESERASKEALYLKIREQIFQEQHDQDNDDDDDDDDDDKRTDSTVASGSDGTSESSIDTSDYRRQDPNQGISPNPPTFPASPYHYPMNPNNPMGMFPMGYPPVPMGPYGQNNYAPTASTPPQVHPHHPLYQQQQQQQQFLQQQHFIQQQFAAAAAAANNGVAHPLTPHTAVPPMMPYMIPPGQNYYPGISPVMGTNGPFLNASPSLRQNSLARGGPSKGSSGTTNSNNNHYNSNNLNNHGGFKYGQQQSPYGATPKMTRASHHQNRQGQSRNHSSYNHNNNNNNNNSHHNNTNGYAQGYGHPRQFNHNGNNYNTYGAMPYDKEMERKLLNNPYIILPEQDAASSSPSATSSNYDHLPLGSSKHGVDGQGSSKYGDNQYGKRQPFKPHKRYDNFANGGYNSIPSSNSEVHTSGGQHGGGVSESGDKLQS